MHNKSIFDSPLDCLYQHLEDGEYEKAKIIVNLINNNIFTDRTGKFVEYDISNMFDEVLKLDSIKFLLENGDDINFINKEGITPVINHLQRGLQYSSKLNYQMAENLLVLGADIDEDKYANNFSESTKKHMASVFEKIHTQQAFGSITEEICEGDVADIYLNRLPTEMLTFIRKCIDNTDISSTEASN